MLQCCCEREHASLGRWQGEIRRAFADLDGVRKDARDVRHGALALGEKGQDQQAIAGPARSLDELLTPFQVLRRLGFIASLDGQRRKAITARNEELRVPDFFGKGQGLPVVSLAFVEGPMALMDLRQEDQGDRQVTALAQPPV